jgi:hypothetical protein
MKWKVMEPLSVFAGVPATPLDRLDLLSTKFT